MTACLWCGQPFEPRRTGGSAQQFHAIACRRAFDLAARIWVRQAVEAGTLTVAQLKQCLQDSARAGSGGHLASAGTPPGASADVRAARERG
jgi:hypothetical protein